MAGRRGAATIGAATPRAAASRIVAADPTRASNGTARAAPAAEPTRLAPYVTPARAGLRRSTATTATPAQVNGTAATMKKSASHANWLASAPIR